MVVLAVTMVHLVSVRLQVTSLIILVAVVLTAVAASKLKVIARVIRQQG